ncbi:MAG: hypothetical protein GY862_13590 [Gammaproteobacteria bacterium]|nr:hypothetical protein [Gammaproteobacteria bacterium]
MNTILRRYGPIPHRERQKGAVLLVALIFLIVLTLLGMSAMDTTIMETRLAANYKERTIAFEMAEAGLVTNDNLITGVAPRERLVADTMITEKTESLLDDFGVARNASGTRKASVNDMRLDFKGFFDIPRGHPLSAYGKKLCFAYFETVATGTNLEIDPESPQKRKGVMEYKLRSGLRQLVPKPLSGC